MNNNVFTTDSFLTKEQSKFMNNNRIKQIRVFSIISILIGILNIISLRAPSLGIVLIVVEVLSLFLMMIMKKYTMFYSLFIIFAALSIEIETFAGVSEYNSFTTIRFLGINIVAWMLTIFIIFALVFKKRKVKRINKKYLAYFYIFLSLIAIGLVIGAINIVLNDNNITNIDYLKHYIAIFYIMGFCPLLFVISSYICITQEEHGLDTLKYAIIGLLIGSCIQGLFSLLSNTRTNLGGLDGVGVAASNIYFYIPLGLMLVFYWPAKSKRLLLLYYVTIFIGIIVFITNNANGKFILFLLLSILMSLLLIKEEKKIIIPFLFVIAISAIIIIYNNTEVFSGYLLSQKIKEIIGLFNIFSPNWLKEMPASPRFRITEFLNIVAEYGKKPWFVFTGKGYLGSIRDHLGMFVRVGGDFSEEQWVNGTFFYLHEAFNLLFLNNGLIGIAFWVSILFLLIKNYRKSFFLVFGCIIFMVTYGYSFVLSMVCFTSIVVGIFECSNKAVKNY